MNNNEQLQAAKDQASQYYGYSDYQSALADCWVGNGNMHKLNEIIDLSMQVYAGNINKSTDDLYMRQKLLKENSINHKGIGGFNDPNKPNGFHY